MRGWVYIISNEAMPGLLKVGFTLKDPSLRARELEGTGVPHPFVVDYEILVENPRALEQSIHKKLANFHEQKEWFRCTLSEAVEAVRVLVGESVLLENLRAASLQNSDSEPVTEQLVAPEINRKNLQRSRSGQIRFAAKFSGQCQYCSAGFSVTVTRHESGATCPVCSRYNDLSYFVSKELSR